MDNSRAIEVKKEIFELGNRFRENNYIDMSKYTNFDVKRGLRNQDGTGVLAGLTRIGNVLGYYVQDGERFPMEGQLFYRGIEITELIDGFVAEDRFGFEETIYLILFGELPNREELDKFTLILDDYREMPHRFTEDMILAAPSRDVMNKLARSVLAMYSYDSDPDNNEYAEQLDKAMRLIALCPVMVAHSFAAKKHYFDNDSLYLHRPKPGLSMAENFLHSIRPDMHFTLDEARLLDLCLVLHAEHGGGNNSAFTCRVVSSSSTDIYSAISAAVGSLKGPRHGGANIKVMEMFNTIENHVRDWKDEDEVSSVLQRILRKELGDGSGLLYGVGHAVYSLSDPRAEMLKKFAVTVAESKNMMEELELFQTVEKLAPEVLNKVRSEEKVYSSNVDFYSGFVHKMLNIPQELFTPLFAISRMVGWCAHRIEEVCNANRIMRPAYKAVVETQSFIPLDNR